MRYEDKTVNRKIVFYGRVSTEHEAQLSALENQLQWYDDQLRKHDNWSLIHKYIDRGITGTMAKKRPSFMEMIADAEKGKFDLIVTREVSRFARNTVDTLNYTRKLKKMGVEVYFVEDNIWTFEQDGELRLTIMAALSQEESRKDSERVRAGQKISRDNGVLFGNGNILGYDLKRNINADGKWNPAENTYTINQEQAETVKMIYDMYFKGLGFSKICKELCRLQRKDACGKVSWSASKISRILHNMTYAGYKGYLKSYVDDFLDHSRVVNHDIGTHMYKKGDWEPIIPEERWIEVQKLIAEKTLKVNVNGENKTKGKKKSEDVWLRKLHCSCGSSFRKNKWRTNKLTGENVFGYQCYNQVNNGSIKLREKYGLDIEGYCDISMVGDWKLNFMAKTILESLWTDRQDAVEEALQLIKDNYKADEVSTDRLYIVNLENTITKNEARLSQLLEMRMDNEITKIEYAQHREKLESEIMECREKLEKTKNVDDLQDDLELKLKEIKKTLDEVIDFSGARIDDAVIDKLVYKVIPMRNGRFRWILNLLGEPNDRDYLCSVDGRKNAPSFNSWNMKKRLPLIKSSTGCN